MKANKMEYLEHVIKIDRENVWTTNQEIYYSSKFSLMVILSQIIMYRNMKSINYTTQSLLRSVLVSHTSIWFMKCKENNIRLLLLFFFMILYVRIIKIVINYWTIGKNIDLFWSCMSRPYVFIICMLWSNVKSTTTIIIKS